MAPSLSFYTFVGESMNILRRRLSLWRSTPNRASNRDGTKNRLLLRKTDVLFHCRFCEEKIVTPTHQTIPLTSVSKKKKHIKAIALFLLLIFHPNWHFYRKMNRNLKISIMRLPLTKFSSSWTWWETTEKQLFLKIGRRDYFSH